MLKKGKKNDDYARYVLVGTYRGNQLSNWNDYYNYPIFDGDEENSDRFSRINELWLFCGKRNPVFKDAEFLGVKTREELIVNYGYPAKGKGHSQKYLLFKTSSKYERSEENEKQVIVRAKDFARTPTVVKEIKEFLESSERTNRALVSKLPSLLTNLSPSVLCVCESTLQLNFLNKIFPTTPYRIPKKKKGKRVLSFIDLFAGIGGIRKGFEIAAKAEGFETRCVFTSEIKPHALDVLKQNNPDEEIAGDITQVDAKEIPDFDFLLAGFPCQAFSSAGKRLGFQDTRGTLFFEVERILKEKNPEGFILENVEGLVNHDKKNPSDKIGNTLETILSHLEMLGYKVAWRVLNAKDFGVPQDRKRIYIVGTREGCPNLDSFDISHSNVGRVMEWGLPCRRSRFVDLLLSHYRVEDLYGRSIKDKRGGKNNIHSWDIEYKGSVSEQEKLLLNAMLRERRKKKWAEEYGIDWMDGMPLTTDMIRTFFDVTDLQEMLDVLVVKKYLKFEHPKRKHGNIRVQDSTLPKGYNIVAGKMSFEVSKVLDPNDVAPTLVAMDMQHIFVPDGEGIRALSLREGLRLFGYPEDFKFDIDVASGYDLLGNTVVVPVIASVAKRVLQSIKGR